MQDRKKKKPSAPSRSHKNMGKNRAANRPAAQPESKGKRKAANGKTLRRKESACSRKQEWKPGNMLYPVPVAMVTVADRAGRDNIITVAWTGTICTNPPMVSISVRPERYSYHMLEETEEFVINLPTRELAYAGELHLTRQKASKVRPPLIGESPVNIECRVTDCIALGSHHMFLAEVAAVHVAEEYLDQSGAFHLEQAGPMVYSHGTYFGLGDALGTFGYSVRKKQKKKENIRKQ